ncbi:serine protease easter-like [Ochlerotatus camptorhynchus]|uniref:serine protease easter-like n=1 Tax=Ochlerotatus camptorhynchus TaxID=644619 RepID=UPI0031DA1383
MKIFVCLIALIAAIQVGAQREPVKLNPSKLALLPKECGVAKYPPYPTGILSKVFEFPWIALVKFNKTRRPATCFGTLINQRYVLSVIGCVRKTKKDPDYIRLGEQSALTDPDCSELKQSDGSERKECAGPVVDIPIESYVSHPEFDQPMYTNDLALMRMSREVEYNDYIRPICLPTTPELLNAIPHDLLLTAWELEMNVPTHYVGELEKYQVENYNLDACQREYEKIGFTPELEINRFCARQKGPNYVCTRMAGAPIGAVVDVEGTQRHVQFAMAKFAPLNCTARQTVPILAMRITEYMEWITDNIEA